MKSNHPLDRDEEVRKLTQYEYWKIKFGTRTNNISSKNLLELLQGPNIKLELSADNKLTVSKTPKPSENVSGSAPEIPEGYNAKWLNLTGNAPTITLSSNQGYKKDDEIEGVHSGQGNLTVQGNGIDLIYPEEYFRNVYPPGAVFGIKFISDTSAALFGKQIPVDL